MKHVLLSAIWLRLLREFPILNRCLIEVELCCPHHRRSTLLYFPLQVEEEKIQLAFEIGLKHRFYSLHSLAITFFTPSFVEISAIKYDFLSSPSSLSKVRRHSMASRLLSRVERWNTELDCA